MGSVIDRYDRDAPDYRELWAPILRTAGLRLLRELSTAAAGKASAGNAPASVAAAGRVLDIGAGVGTLLPELARTFPRARVFGVDRSRGMLALAPKEYPLAVMDATRLGIAAKSMDLVLIAFVLFHLENPLDGLREARRVLRSGGHLGTLTWAGELESPATRIWVECLDAHGATPIDPETQTRHERVDCPEKMKTLMTEAGFRSIRTWKDELSAPMDLELLVRMRTRVGGLKPRFDSLEPGDRETFLTAVRGRLRGLGPGDFVARGGVVYAVASA